MCIDADFACNIQLANFVVVEDCYDLGFVAVTDFGWIEFELDLSMAVQIGEVTGVVPSHAGIVEPFD